MIKFLLATVCTLPLALGSLAHAQSTTAPADTAAQISADASTNNNQMDKSNSSTKDTEAKRKAPCDEKTEEPKTEASSDKLPDGNNAAHADTGETDKVLNPIITANDNKTPSDSTTPSDNAEEKTDENRATSDDVVNANLEKKN